MLRKQVLIGLTALGLVLGSGAAAAMPVGLQGLPSNALIQERGATAEPVHFRKRRHVVVKRHFVHPRRHVLVHPRTFRHPHVVRRHHFVHPHHFAPRHRFVHRHHYRTRPRVSFGLSFGW